MAGLAVVIAYGVTAPGDRRGRDETTRIRSEARPRPSRVSGKAQVIGF
jgi:hypothetical protein